MYIGLTQIATYFCDHLRRRPKCFVSTGYSSVFRKRLLSLCYIAYVRAI